jgi:maltooligosyltrehalose trehalohydrolase
MSVSDRPDQQPGLQFPTMSPPVRRLPIGAEVQSDGSTHFRVWAPDPKDLILVVDRSRGSRENVTLTREANGYYSASVADVTHGTRYWYQIDGDLVADPASRFQPDGPFGPSQVVDPTGFRWRNQEWRGISADRRVVYEMHLGTFTPEGTWRAAIQKLPELAAIGVTVLEVMPVSEFPGRFGWGYDGVFPYAPTRLYGDPDDFRTFVDHAHGLGLAVILDVVYNHLGPDGCVFGRYAKRYYTSRYDNEWGDALNFDVDDAAPAREYWRWNGAYWIDEFQLDGLRLDATQTIHDQSPEHILAAISKQTRAAAPGRELYLVAENERQEARLVRPLEEGGYGLDGIWNDDFHHTARVALTGRREAYYSDHSGSPQELISAAKYGYLFQGQRYAWQKMARGTSTRGVPRVAFVNFIENHDQVANSGDGSRVRMQTSADRYRAMVALALLMPGTPMLFQGQEFGATTPFLYFADHKPELAAAVRKGRAEFVSQFASLATPSMIDRLPAPDDERTFEQSKLDWSEFERQTPWRQLFRDVLEMRARHAAFSPATQQDVDGAVLAAEAFVLRYFMDDPLDERLLVINLGRDLVKGSFAEPLVAPPDGHEWRMQWCSESPEYGGEGVPDDVAGPNGWRIIAHSATVLRPEKTDGGS